LNEPDNVDSVIIDEHHNFISKKFFHNFFCTDQNKLTSEYTIYGAVTFTECVNIITNTQICAFVHIDGLYEL